MLKCHANVIMNPQPNAAKIWRPQEQGVWIINYPLSTSIIWYLNHQLSVINPIIFSQTISDHLSSLCQRATWICITCYDMMTATDWPLSSDWTNSLTSHRKWNKWTMDNGPWKASRAWLELHNFRMVARSGFQSKWLTVDTPAHNKVQWILEVVWEWWTVDKWW